MIINTIIVFFHYYYYSYCIPIINEGRHFLLYRTNDCPAEPGQVEVRQGQPGVHRRPSGILEGNRR